MSFMGSPRARGFFDMASFALAASYVSTRAYRPGSTPCSLKPPTPSARYISPPPFLPMRTKKASSPPFLTLSGWGRLVPVAMSESLEARTVTEADREATRRGLADRRRAPTRASRSCARAGIATVKAVKAMSFALRLPEGRRGVVCRGCCVRCGCCRPALSSSTRVTRRDDYGEGYTITILAADFASIFIR